jgi:capsular exopolysaccharide synthesis family protein
MERLQAAIEKARERRLTGPSAAPRKRAAGESQEAVETREIKARDVGTWDHLALIKTNEKKLLRNRIFASTRSREAVYFDKLRTKVMQQCKDNGWKRILVTSPSAGCGKTTTVSNIAASFARQLDRRLIVHEFDLRRPTMAKLFGHSAAVGLSDTLEGSVLFETAAVRYSDNVILSMNKGPHPTPSKLILQDSTPRILDEIEARYSPDLTIFDSPPLLATDDALALLKVVDCVLIIAAAEVSSTAEVDSCEKEIAEQTNVLGIVLNKCNYMDDDYGYGYSV